MLEKTRWYAPSLAAIAAATLIVLAPGTTLGQARIGWGFDAVHSAVLNSTSAANKIAPGGWGLRVFAARFPRRFAILGGDAGAYLHKDSLESTVSTNKGSATSAAQFYDISAWAGLRSSPRLIDTTSPARVSVAIVSGYSASLGAQVRHESCVNCPERDITVSGGPFFEPSISLMLTTYGIGLHYRRYFGGDRHQVLAFRFSLLQ